ncbi:hsp70 nucleotide exchange factor fes1-like protein, putative [Babesia ovata]|uniref:Hsp70 nucleotide exchange factor fes1-like protein, putative n=1 Tax=Babesia ovata TaxID=189622 RepID=A0A2H6K829_9APIC|nr:hsp70 nucleotide exchange factor fes1-like protein, putative [Babesia ovata]GBE59140.1 hsp70 nucleotide exchange factor fes1-like protein, putative [Babesia ovata]
MDTPPHCVAEKPLKHSEANAHLKLGVKKARTVKGLDDYLAKIKMSLPDWKGLLKWTLKHVPENSTGNTRPIAKEDVEFLQKAMESVHDHDDKVKRAAQLIQQSSVGGAEYDVSQLLDAFDTMEQYYEEHPGNASSAHRTGVLAAVIEHLGKGDRNILPAALSVGWRARCDYGDAATNDYAIKQQQGASGSGEGPAAELPAESAGAGYRHPARAEADNSHGSCRKALRHGRGAVRPNWGPDVRKPLHRKQ